MKTTTSIYAIAMCLSIALFSCSKKDSTSSPATSSNSSWSFEGQNYKGAITVFTNNSLLSTDEMSSSSQDVISIDFASRPAAGTYSVIKSYSGFGSMQCAIESSGSGYPSVYSAGGGTVTVTISGGKISATFNSIPMNDVTDQKNASISGTLTEQ